jgi:hypothetical protein
VSALDGTNGFKITGNFREVSGFTVASGDINGDGFADIITARPSGNSKGFSVIFGKATWEGSMNLADLNTTPGLGFSYLGGISASPLIGLGGADTNGSIVTAADLNGDGFEDVIVGSRYSDSPDNGQLRGAAFVIFGKGTGLNGIYGPSDLDGAKGFAIYGVSDRDFTGTVVSGADDVNGDRIDDLIITAPTADGGGTDRGTAYVLLGNKSGFGAIVNLSSLDGSNGFKVTGASDSNQMGVSAGGAGDVNGDGIGDIIVGSDGAAGGGAQRGESYVVYGRSSGQPSALSVSSLDGTIGFKLNGVDDEDFAGATTAGAGDVNNDGKADILIGAPGVGEFNGGAYVVFGGAIQGDTGGNGGERPQVVISKNHKTATFTDIDGDKVTVKTKKGAFEQANFLLRAEGLGAQLETVDLHNLTTFSGSTITFKAQSQDANHDGTKEGNKSVNADVISAGGISLKKIKTSGEIGSITAGTAEANSKALGTLIAGSLTDSSFLFGTVGSVKLKHDLTGSLHVIGGPGLADHDGLALNKVVIRGNVDGSVSASENDEAGLLEANGGIGSISIGGDLRGGDMRSGIIVGGILGAVTIGGDVRSANPATPVTIAALGKVNPASQIEATAINAITIRGDVLNARILAGYDRTLSPLNPNASINRLAVRGDWAASSVAAGVVDVTNDGFGRNDTPVAEEPTDTIVARIASITIEGTAIGSASTNVDFFGITAQHIEKVVIGTGPALTFSDGADDLLLDSANSDFRALDFA